VSVSMSTDSFPEPESYSSAFSFVLRRRSSTCTARREKKEGIAQRSQRGNCGRAETSRRGGHRDLRARTKQKRKSIARRSGRV
jgi:hypothetical protein